MLIGNAGNNIFDGKEGTDTVQIYGLSKDYSIDVQTDQITVTHIARQEVDVLKNIEILRFFDVDLMAQDSLSHKMATLVFMVCDASL